jgi:hypothetical protein
MVASIAPPVNVLATVPLTVTTTWTIIQAFLASPVLAVITVVALAGFGAYGWNQ